MPLGPARRIESVLEPVIPVVGDLVRRTPGTLSLAQGMVGWGPPPEVAAAVQAALGQPGRALDRYGPTWGNRSCWRPRAGNSWPSTGSILRAVPC